MNEHDNSTTSAAPRVDEVADQLIQKIGAAVSDLKADDLLTDRSALRHITGALKDLQELKERCAEKSVPAAPVPAPALTVVFAGDTEEMSE